MKVSFYFFNENMLCHVFVLMPFLCGSHGNLMCLQKMCILSPPPPSPVNLSSKIQTNNYLELFICILEIWLLKWIFEWLLEKYFKMTAVQHSDVVINTVGSQQGVGLNTLAEGFHICVVSLHFLPWCKDLPGLGYGNNNNSVKTNYSCQAGGTAVSDLR